MSRRRKIVMPTPLPPERESAPAITQFEEGDAWFCCIFDRTLSNGFRIAGHRALLAMRRT